jgi:flagellar basal body rod protein FlgG
VIYGLYHSAAGLATNEYRQAVLANNIANADTAGFKRDIAAFAERLTARTAGVRRGDGAPSLAGLSGGLWLGQTVTDFSDAPKTATGNWQDIALDGPGFLVVETNGRRLLTRDGRLLVDANGRLTAASDGAPVLGAGGGPVQVNPRGGTPQIDERGRIQQDGALVGELEIVDVKNYAGLRKVGAARFAAADEELAPSFALVQGGYVEGSGVQPLTELVSMMEASHAYQMNARMITLQDESLGRLISGVLRA